MPTAKPTSSLLVQKLRFRSTGWLPSLTEWQPSCIRACFLILWFKGYVFVLPAMADILDFWVIMMSLRQTDVRIGILVVAVPEKNVFIHASRCYGLKVTFSFYQLWRPSWISGSLRETDVRIGILVVDVPKKVSSYMLLRVLV